MMNVAKRKPWDKFWVDRDLVKSRAFADLSGVAPQILLLFHTKRQFQRVQNKHKKTYVCTNNGQIQFTYKEGESYGYTARQFTKAINNLVRCGFVDISQRGFHHSPTLYALSERWRAWGTDMYEQRKRAEDRRGFRRKAAETSRKLRGGGTPKDTNLYVGISDRSPENDVTPDAPMTCGENGTKEYQHKGW